MDITQKRDFLLIILFVFITLLLNTSQVLSASAGKKPGEGQDPPLQSASTSTKAAATGPFVPGEVLVKFQPYINLADAQALLQTAGLEPLEVSSRGRLIRVQVTPNHEADIITQLTAWQNIAFVTYNYRVQAVNDPNDPEYWRQWPLKQADDHDIDAPEAWDIHVGSHNITIAIVDTGVDLDHPDLQANIVPGYDFVNGDNTPDDDHGHGTHVAGIAAAVGNNGIGIAGVSWIAGIMPLKVLDKTGSGTTYNVSQAIYYAVDNGAKVINMSLGVPGSTWPCDWPHIEDALNDAVNNGVLVVAAAGNDGQDGVNCPAAYDQVTAVGSTTANDTRSSFSNYGLRLDIAAPGSGIYSTLPGGYGSLSGTSMATPHVAGLAALLWSFVPSLTDSQVRDIILETVDDLYPSATDDCGTTYPDYVNTSGWDPCFGYGRLNAGRALASMSIQISPEQLTLLIDDESGLASSTIQLATTNPHVITWTATISPAVSWLALSSPASGTLSAASSPLGVTVVATNTAVTYGTYTTTVVITGTTSSAEIEIGPIAAEVQLNYIPENYKLYLPIVLRN